MSIWIQTMAALVLSGSLVYGQGAGENPPAASPASNVSGAPIEAGEPVDTIPGLRALATPEKPSQLVRWVKGYHAIGDGGGGNYVYNAHSSTPDNGGVVIAPNSGKGRWLLEFSGTVNVRQFGAFGDGRHDDTKAIRDAIDSLLETSTPRDYGAEHRDGPVGRGSVYIPPGIYVCQNVLLRSGICIRGAGEQVTTLLLKGGTQYLTDPKDPTSATPGNLFCTVLSYDGSYSDYTFGRQTWTDGAFARSKKWESSRRIVRDVTIADLTIDGNKAENLVGDGTDRYPKNGTVMAAGVNLMFADNVRLRSRGGP